MAKIFESSIKAHLYINMWESKDEAHHFYEHDAVYSIEDAIKDYHEWDWTDDTYALTLKLDLVNGTFERIDITDYIEEEDEDEDSVGEEYERLTGHEMGVCPGRV
jgi:hypothetical protein